MDNFDKKPILQNFALCMNSSHDAIRGLCVENVLSYLNPEFVPGQFSFCIVFTIINLEKDRKYSLHIRMEHKDSSEEVLKMDTDEMFFSTISNNNIPQVYNGVNVSIDCKNVKFVKAGEYILKITIGEDMLKETSIYVKGKNENA